VFEVQTIPLGYNNVYLVEMGGSRVLVDAGPDYRGAAETLAAATEGRRPESVVVTHGHNDHAGLGNWWRDREGTPVFVSTEDARLVRAPHFSVPGEFEAFARYVEASGAPDALQWEVIKGLDARRQWVRRAARSGEYRPARRGERWPTGLHFEPFEPELLWDGPKFGGLTAVLCPGHTPGNLVLVAEEEGLLFSGDQLLPHITPTPGIQFVQDDSGDWVRFPSLPPFVASLERLRAYRFVRCYPGHGDPFDNVTETIAQNLAQVEQRTERVFAELREAGEASVHSLSERLYPRALGRRWWQIVATVQGHLDLLADRTLASYDGDGWRPAS
jgi:glyoxylase-like metal-dependent hydrolase (beta-lactamase superfamily II)